MASLERGRQKARRALSLLVFCCLIAVGCSKKTGSDWTYQERVDNEGATVTQHIEFLEERLKNRPKSFLEQAELAGYYLQRGKARRSPEDIDNALKWVQTSLSIQENSAALMVKADSLQMTHRFQESMEVLDRILEQDPSQVGALMLSIQVALARGDVESANKRLESLPDLPLSSYLFLRGQVAEANRETEKARQFYQDAIRREGDSGSKSESARMRGVLARLEISEGNLNEANALLEAAHSIPVEQPLTEAQRARLMSAEGRHQDAAELLRAAFEHYRDPLFLVRLGEVQLAAQKPDEAGKTFATAARLLEGDPYGHERDLALCLYYVNAEENEERIKELMAAELERRKDEETLRVAELVGVSSR